MVRSRPARRARRAAAFRSASSCSSHSLNSVPLADDRAEPPGGTASPRRSPHDAIDPPLFRRRVLWHGRLSAPSAAARSPTRPSSSRRARPRPCDRLSGRPAQGSAGRRVRARLSSLRAEQLCTVAGDSFDARPKLATAAIEDRNLVTKPQAQDMNQVMRLVGGQRGRSRDRIEVARQKTRQRHDRPRRDLVTPQTAAATGPTRQSSTAAALML